MVLVLAHRGASAACPENTIEAFREAARLGADGVELDARRSADHAVVVHHDAVLADGRAIVDLTVGDLPPGVPLLGAALDACAGMLVNVEIKNVAADPDFDPEQFLVTAVTGLVADRGCQQEVVVSSFNWDTVDLVAEADPAVGRAYLSLAQWDQRRAVERLAARGHHALHAHHLAVNAELVAAAHDLGVEVRAWTVNDPDRMRWLAECGVDAIITDVPDVALGALR